MKKILYATDFSESSRRSFSYALQTARLFGAELVLVHVYQIPDTYKFPYTWETLEFEKKEISSSRNKLQKIFDTHYRTEYEDVNIRYRVIKDSSVFRGISDAIYDEFPDVLILGAKGDNISQNKMFGGVVKRLINDTGIPVMTIPEDLSAPTFSKILFTSNLYESDLVAIEQLVYLVGAAKPEITIVHVRAIAHDDGAQKTEIFWNAIRKTIDYPNLKFQELLADNVYKGLNEYINKNKFDVLTMTQKEHGGLFYRMLHNDLIQKIETQSTIPVLSFNEDGLEFIKNRDISIEAFKDSISKELKEIRRIEENQILASITRVTSDIEANYPELYQFLEEEPLTLPTDRHPQVDNAAMSDYLNSLEEILSSYKKNLGK